MNIDIVYSWVDASDPSWKKQYRQNPPATAINPRTSYSLRRFRDNSELKYSLYSLEKYADFVNHIYIVTADQKPRFLSGKERDITLISHRDIIPAHHLPTFNSICVEAFLHKIPGLTEYFMYLNDDIFFRKHVSIKDFINPGNHKIIIFLTKELTPLFHYDMSGSGFSWALANTNRFLNREFKQQNRYQLAHAPQMQHKPSIEEIHQLYPQVIEHSLISKYRSIYSINFTNGLYPYYLDYKGKTESQFLQSNRFSIIDEHCINKITMEYILHNASKFICIQDERETVINNDIERLLSTIYPRIIVGN